MDIEKIKHLLNGWPKGSIGYEKEKQIIDFLYKSGQEIGHGRIEQLAQNLYKSMEDPSVVEKLKKLREKHFELMNWTDKE